MTPFYDAGAFGYPVAMAIAVVLGILFGFVMERAGFGRASVLVSQFYNDDMRVFKVMFTAIVTASIGIGVLHGFGVLNVAWLDIPKSWIVPQIVAGTLLGVGFVMSGYCPGTALISIGSGLKDGAVALAGIMLGALVFGVFWDPIQPFYESDGQGAMTFTDTLGIPWQILAFAVALVAIAGFLVAEKVEPIFAKKQNTITPTNDPQLRNAVFGVLLLGATIGLVTLAFPKAAEEEHHAPEIASISAIELAQEIVTDDRALYIVDLRSNAECMEDRVRGAMCVPEDDPDAEFLSSFAPTRTMVLYADSNLETLPASINEFEGTILTLDGGFQAFQATILEAPEPPETATTLQLEAFTTLSALHSFFTGSTAPAAPVIARPVVRREAAARGGGC